MISQPPIRGSTGTKLFKQDGITDFLDDLGNRVIRKINREIQMNFYKIVFTDGSEVQEFGDSEADLRDFVARCYCTRTISQIVQL